MRIGRVRSKILCCQDEYILGNSIGLDSCIRIVKAKGQQGCLSTLEDLAKYNFLYFLPPHS
jgi:hypothetical protein